MSGTHGFRLQQSALDAHVPPWDRRIDTLILTWPLIAWIVRPTAALVVASFAVALVVHPLIAWIGFVLGARRSARWAARG